MANISSLNSLRQILFPVPSIAEQTVIVGELERHQSLIDKIANAIQENVEKAKNLRKSILKSAFEGKLVSQSDKDNPANSHLENIEKTSRESNSEVDQRRKSGSSVTR